MAMAAERAKAAEMMAPAAAVVMVGVILGLGRVGGGSGWRQRAYGGQHFEMPAPLRGAGLRFEVRRRGAFST